MRIPRGRSPLNASCNKPEESHGFAVLRELFAAEWGKMLSSSRVSNRFPDRPETTMQPDDNRKQQRYPLAPQPEHKVLVTGANGERQRARGVKDISAAGMSVYLDKPIPAGASITVALEDGQMNLEVYGRVVWCKASPDTGGESSAGGSFAVGLELRSPTLMSAFLRNAK